MKIVKSFFSTFSCSDKIHNSIIEIEKEIDKKYLEMRKSQKTLFDFMISKQFMIKIKNVRLLFNI
jgi:hypothetical protein